MMRRIFSTLLLLGTIVLFTAAGGNRVPQSGGAPEPPCSPCEIR